MKQRTTLKKMAKDLGLSVSTVSKALHNNKDISLENRRRVQQYAKKINYRPNLVAVALKRKKSKTIGLVIPEIVHYFFSEIIKGVEETAIARGYNVIIGVSNESHEKEVLCMQMLASGGVDGFLISVANESYKLKKFDHLHDYINSDFGIVLFDRAVPSVPCSKVYIDDGEAAKDAINCLVANGRREILIVSSDDHLLISDLRVKGAMAALQANGLNSAETRIIRADHTTLVDDASKFEQTLLRKVKAEEKIDGLFAVTEISAITAINVLEKNGYRVPDDIAVIGFSDGILAKISRPRLSVVDQHAIEIGRKACAVLIDQLESQEEFFFPKDYIVKSKIIGRESIGPPSI